MNARMMRSPVLARSLSSILAFALSSLSMLILLLASGPLLWSYVQSEQATISTNQQLITQSAAKTVKDFTEQRLNTLIAASKLTNLAAGTPSQQAEVLQRLLGYDMAFVRIEMIAPQGHTLAQSSRRSLAATDKFDPNMVEDLLRETKQEHVYIGPVLIDPITSEPQVLIAVPVINLLGNSTSALAAVVNLKFMWKLVDQLDVGEGGVAYVIDRKGNLLAFRDSARVLLGENVANLHIVQDFVGNISEHSISQPDSYQGILGTDVIGDYVALGTPDWAVVTEIPWSVAYRGVRSTFRLAIAILIGSTILAGGTGLYIARRLSTPLVRLMDTANRIAAGERELQATPAGPREVTALAQAFNTMTAQLRATLEGLEQRVTQRTAALHTALAEVETRADEQARLLAELAQQRQAIRELSIPILPVTGNSLVVPLIGAIDSERLVGTQERVLGALERSRVRYLLLDITGVPVVDSQVAQGLLTIATMSRMLGCETILVGIRPEVAQSIVGLGLDLKGLRTAANLQAALQGIIDPHA